MGAIAAYNFAAWQASFPQFPGVTTGQAEGYWTMATTILANDGSGPVPTTALQSTLLNLLTAHIASLFVNADGTYKANGQPVGRVASVSQGSESASFDFGPMTTNQAWFVQTQYGALYWQMTAGFRLGQYRVSGAALGGRFLSPGALRGFGRLR